MTTPFSQAIADFTPELPLAVGYSGGADSTALLLACAEKWPAQVRAIHIHHGIQVAADEFSAHCQAFCAQHHIPFLLEKVSGKHRAGQSPEDAARRARYAGFDQAAQQTQPTPAIRSIALAQHADDQVETLLLALSRGAGLPGLSGMPTTWRRAGLAYHRPLLRVAAQDVRQWLKARPAHWIEDPSNTDERYTRNRIRAHLLPALAQALPAFRDTFARSAMHAAQAQRLLTEVAVQDLLTIGTPPQIAPLQQLSKDRQANVLRHWLTSTFGQTPSSAQLAECLDQIQACTTRAHQINIKLGTGFLTRQKDGLDWYNPAPLL